MRDAPLSVATHTAPSAAAATATAGAAISLRGCHVSFAASVKSVPPPSTSHSAPSRDSASDAAPRLVGTSRHDVPSKICTPACEVTYTPPLRRGMMEVMMPRSGAPCTAGTGVIDLPSKLATPSSVPIHKTPSELCATAITDDCGSPRQLDLLNVRNARVGVHSSATRTEALKRSASAQTRIGPDGVIDGS